MTAQPTLDTARPARPAAEKDDRSARGAPERRTTSAERSSSEVARSSSRKSQEPRGPRTYLPGYYLG